MTEKATLLERISNTSIKFDSWPAERQTTVMKDAFSSPNYLVRAKSFSDATKDYVVVQKKK